MPITIYPLTKEDYEQLYVFELENRLFFEQQIPSRGDDYYEWATFCLRNDVLLVEQQERLGFPFLIKNEEKEIVGRVNLVKLDWQDQSGEVGYRVAEQHTGKGYANAALQQLIAFAKKEQLVTLKAIISTANIASQKVLERNGFQDKRTTDDAFELNGEILKLVHYEKALS